MGSRRALGLSSATRTLLAVLCLDAMAAAQSVPVPIPKNVILPNHDRVFIGPMEALEAGAFALGPTQVELAYGQEMAAAGPLAAMFFLIHGASLFYVPLSMAVIARESGSCACSRSRSCSWL